MFARLASGLTRAYVFKPGSNLRRRLLLATDADWLALAEARFTCAQLKRTFGTY